LLTEQESFWVKREGNGGVGHFDALSNALAQYREV